MKGKVLITNENGLHFTCSESQLLISKSNLLVVQERINLIDSNDFKILEINTRGEIIIECFTAKKIGIGAFEKKIIRFWPRN